MKVIIDENLSPDWIPYLTRAGLEVVHWSTIGSGDAPDREILLFAATYGYVFLTQDLDFGIALAQSRSIAPSVIQLRTRDVNPAKVGSRVVAAIWQATPELEKGAVVTIDTRSEKPTRITSLPIRTQ